MYAIHVYTKILIHTRIESILQHTVILSLLVTRERHLQLYADICLCKVKRIIKCHNKLQLRQANTVNMLHIHHNLHRHHSRYHNYTLNSQPTDSAHTLCVQK